MESTKRQVRTLQTWSFPKDATCDSIIAVLTSTLACQAHIPEASDPLLSKALSYLGMARYGAKEEWKEEAKEAGNQDGASLSPVIASVRILSFQLDYKLLEGRATSFFIPKQISQIIAMVSTSFTSVVCSIGVSHNIIFE